MGVPFRRRRRRKFELDFPLEDSGAGGGGFSLGYMSGALQGDGKRSVGKRVGGRESGQRQRRGNGLFEAS